MTAADPISRSRGHTEEITTVYTDPSARMLGLLSVAEAAQIVVEHPEDNIVRLQRKTDPASRV